MSLFQRVIVSALTFMAMSIILPGSVFVSSIWSAVIAGLVLAILNVCVKPILHVLSIPITLITFGLFSFVINAFVLQMTSFFVSGVSFSGFGSALITALVMSFVNSVVENRNADRY